jgi:biopolymer transport protein ExbB/TolQ
MTLSQQRWALFLVSWVSHEALQLLEKLKPVQSVKSSVQKADQIVQKMKEVTEWAQMTMTVTQQIQKEVMNQKRQQSYDFKKEDKIWLNLKNIHTDCLCKKFDAKNVKYIIVKKISSHSFCLNTLSDIHNVFHSVMLHQQSWTLFLLSVWQTAIFVTNCKQWRRVWDKEDSEEEICMT